MINLRLPLAQINTTQLFGQDFWYSDPKTGKKFLFYQSYGLNGHPGIDFKANIGCPVYATHDGICLYAGYDETNGNLVQVWDEKNNFKTLYGHNSEMRVKQGDIIKEGQLIALSGKTGAGTGPHVHFGLKPTRDGGNGLNNGNGYNGAIDPAPYFTKTYNGIIIKNKDWDKSRSYHRYYREDVKRNLDHEREVAAYMERRLKRQPSNEEINACIWGGWDIETVMNDGMYMVWSQLKKDEFVNKKMKPFN